MLSSLGRNGFIESLAVTRQHRSTPVLHCRLRHASCLITVGSDRLAWKSPSAFAAHPLSIRLLSTPPPPGTTNATKAAPQAPPTPASPLRKHKVELRPGPVKPAKLPHSVTEAATASSKPLTASPGASSASSETPSSKSESLVEATKHDFEDASQHGILAPPPENASWAGKLWHQGKELFKFYWKGIKLIWSNRKHARMLEERVKAGGAPLSRWETKFISMNKQDTLKLIPFLLMIIIIEEIIPLVVLYAPFLLPSTCLLPSQKERIATKRREKQKAYALEHKLLFEKLRQRLLANPGAPVQPLLDSSALVAINGLLALSTSGPSSMLMSRLQRHLASIAEDDALLKRESFGQALTQPELQEALEERGIITDGLSPNACQSRLQWWLNNVDSAEHASALHDPFGRRVMLVASSGAGKY